MIRYSHVKITNLSNLRKELYQILKIKVDGVYTDKKIDEFEKVKEKEKIIDGDIVRDKYFDIILFKNKTFNLTTKEDIEEYLKSKPKKK